MIISDLSMVIELTEDVIELTEDQMIGWHHRLEGHEFEQTPGVGDG